MRLRGNARRWPLQVADELIPILARSSLALCGQAIEIVVAVLGDAEAPESGRWTYRASTLIFDAQRCGAAARVTRWYGRSDWARRTAGAASF
jgi:hypothetical protein